MNEDAIQDSYNLFVDTGYKGSIDDYKTLVSTNPDALKDSHDLFVKEGYNGDIEKFTSLLGIKKKKDSDSTSQNPDLASEAKQVDGLSATQEPNTIQLSEDELNPKKETESSDTTNSQIEEKSVLEKGIDFAKGMANLRFSQGKDALKHLATGTSETLAGLSGIGNFINKIKFNTTLGVAKMIGVDGVDDFEKTVNELPQDKREELIGTLESISNPISGALAKVSANEQEHLTDLSEEISAKTKQYEGNIIDDIKSGNLDQAATRVVNGIFGSAPSLVLAAAPGGLVAIGAGSAAQKQEELEREGEKLDTNSIMNSIVNGTAEAIFEKVTVGLLKPLKGVLKGNSKLATEFSENFTLNLFKSIGMESSSEAATTLTQQLSDSFFKGEELPENFWANIADSALIGGVMGGGISTVTLAAKKVMPEDKKNEVEKTEQQINKVNEDIKKDIPEDVKKELKTVKLNLEAKLEESTKSDFEKFKAMPKNDRLKLGDTEKKIDALKKEYDEISNNELLSEDSKRILLADKSKQAEDLLNQKQSLINAKSKETTTETKEQEVEATTPSSEVKQESVEPTETEGIEDTPNLSNQKEKAKTNFKIKDQDTFYHASDSPRQGRLRTSEAPQFGIGVYFSTNKELVEEEYGNDATTSVKLKIENPVKTSTKQWYEVEELALKKANEGKPIDEDGAIDGEETDIAEINSSFISDSAKELGYDAIIDEDSMQYDNEIVVLDESKIIYPEDEKTQTKNTTPNGDVQPGVEPSVQQGQNNDTQPTVEPETSEGEAKVKTYKLSESDKAPTYNVDFKDGVLEIKDEAGKTPSKPTIRKVRDKYVNDLDFTNGKLSNETPENRDDSIYTNIANTSKNPSEIAKAIATFNKDDIIKNNADPLTVKIAEYIGSKSIEKSDFERFGDRNNINRSIALQYFAPKGKGLGIDDVAMNIEYEFYGDYNANEPRVTEQMVVDFITENPKGTEDFIKNIYSEELNNLNSAFTNLTGLPVNEKYIQLAIEQQNKKDKLDDKINKDYLDLLTEEELLNLSNEKEKFQTNTFNQSFDSEGNIIGSQGESKVQRSPRTENESEGKEQQSEIDDDTKAQGVSLSKENNRDSALSKEGVIKQKNARQRKFKRFWNNTFSSNRGLDRKTVSVVESLIGELSAISTAIKHEASQFGKISKDIKKKFKKDYNEKMLLINDYLSGIDTDLSFLKTEQIEQIDALRGRIDNLSDKIKDILENKKKELAKKGDDNKFAQDAIKRIDALIDTIEGNKGKYMFRSYDAFSNKEYLSNLTGKHPNAAAKKRLDNAIDFVMNDQDITEAEARNQILTYLDDLKGSGDFVSASTEGKAKAPFLKKRKDIPQPIRELLGESKDPVKNYVSTVFGMSKYIASMEYQQRLHTALFDSNVAETEMKPGYTKLVGSKEGWDILQDVYVPEEVAEGIADLQPLDSIKDGAYKWMVMLSATTKLGKTVLSPTTTARNIWSGIFLSLNAGFNPFSDPKLFVDGIKHSWGTKKTQKELKSENQRLIKLGIINDGAVSREILGIMNDFKAPIDNMLSQSYLDKFMTVMQKLYALGDDSYKVVGFYTWEGRYKKAGFSSSESETMAMERIRNGFPTYSKIPRNIQKLRRIPVIGTFPSFTYEVWRTTYNNIKFIGQDLKAGVQDKNKQRLLMSAQQSTGMIVASSMAYAVSEFSKAMLGIDDDEDDTTRNMAAPWQKDSKNIYIGKSKGTYDVIDGTAFFPAESILKPMRILLEDREGRDIDDKVRLSLKEATSAFLSTDIFAKTVEEIHQNKDNYGRKIYDGENILEGIANDPDKLANYILRQAGPGIYNNISEFARANEVAPDFFGEKETSYKEYTNTEALLGLIGFRLSRINYVSGISNLAFESKNKEREKKSEITRKLKSTRKLSEDNINSYIDEYDKFAKESNKTVLLSIKGAKKQGIPISEIETSLSLSGYSKKDIGYLVFGLNPPLKPIGETTVKNTKKRFDIGRFKNDPEKLYEMKNNLDSNIELFNFLIDWKNYQNSTKKATNN